MARASKKEIIAVKKLLFGLPPGHGKNFSFYVLKRLRLDKEFEELSDEAVLQKIRNVKSGRVFNLKVAMEILYFFETTSQGQKEKEEFEEFARELGKKLKLVPPNLE